MRKLIREPLLHFLLLGSVLFLIHGLSADSRPPAPDRIVVDADQVARLSEQFRRTWMRPPTQEELRGLAEDFVREEVLYREALALGLDRNDLVIRRRMRQKMEFMNADLTDLRKPTDAELQTFLRNHAERFRIPGRSSFTQIYVDPATGAADPEKRARALLRRLNSEPPTGGHPLSMGDATLLPPGQSGASRQDIAAVFGTAFADAVMAAPQGQWSGPYSSAYGLHLVRVDDHRPDALPALGEIRELVTREWLHQQRGEANERFYRALRDRYAVEIHLPTEADGDHLAARQP
jgi:hypothetical protein